MDDHYDLNFKSEPIIITDYQESWGDEFQALGKRLRTILKEEALRIDHIGSTSVPELAAKDIIDIQITIKDFKNIDGFSKLMKENSFRKKEEFLYDSFCGLGGKDPENWRKLFFREPEGERRSHIHVRASGKLNQKYPLLFRDYLRSNFNVKQCYEILKRRLSKIFPENIEGYLFIKDPLMDILFEGAQVWALQSGWTFDDHYL